MIFRKIYRYSYSLRNILNFCRIHAPLPFLFFSFHFTPRPNWTSWKQRVFKYTGWFEEKGATRRWGRVDGDRSNDRTSRPGSRYHRRVRLHPIHGGGFFDGGFPRAEQRRKSTDIVTRDGPMQTYDRHCPISKKLTVASGDQTRFHPMVSRRPAFVPPRSRSGKLSRRTTFRWLHVLLRRAWKPDLEDAHERTSSSLTINYSCV